MKYTTTKPRKLASGKRAPYYGVRIQTESAYEDQALAQLFPKMGKPRHGVTSRFKGVSWHPGAKKFQANVRYNYRNIYIGLFVDETEAAYAYDREARARFGSFARPNFPLPPMVIREAVG